MSEKIMSREDADFKAAAEGVARKQEIKATIVNIIREAGEGVNESEIFEETRKRAEMEGAELQSFNLLVEDLIGKGEVIREHRMGKGDFLSVPEK